MSTIFFRISAKITPLVFSLSAWMSLVASVTAFAEQRLFGSEPSLTERVGSAHPDALPADSKAGAAPSPGAPHVVIIMLDDVGFGQLSAYGGPLATPNIDKLAAGGLRYNNFHTTSLELSTYAVLLIGRNPHSIGLAETDQAATGNSDADGHIPKRAATLAEILRLAGYNTLAVGKWPLVPPVAATAAGPFDQWPLGMGFERFYGFLGRETDQWRPILTADNHRIETPVRSDYHLAADLTDQAIASIRDQRQAGSSRPFFLFLAYGAAHPPQHAPKEW